MSDILKVGILGCGSIAQKNARAIIRASKVTLHAVASRNVEKCQNWCDALQLPADIKKFGSYQALLEDPSIDLIYLATPTATHIEWVPKAAAAGKHILVEKPVGRDAAETQRMIDCCRDAKVRLMDGLMFAHHARWAKIETIFNDPLTWQPLRVTGAFTLQANQEFLANNIRCKSDADPLGCIGDLGYYLLRVGLYAFRWEWPKSVRATFNSVNSEGVPLDVDVQVHWPPMSSLAPAFAMVSSSGDAAEQQKDALPLRMLTFHCSFLHPWSQWYDAVSLNGKVVRCRDLVIPRREQVCDFEVEQIIGPTEFATASVADNTVVPTLDCAQEVCMWDEMAKLILTGQSQSYQEKAIIMTHIIIDAILASGKQDGALVKIQAVEV